MKFIQTSHAPQAIGPYAQAVFVNDTLYVSGQLPINPLDDAIPSDIKAQTEQALQNLFAVVEAAGLKPTDIVKCGVFLKDLNDFKPMNEVYERLFGSHTPARAAIEVARLPKDVKIEIDAIAVKQRF